MKKHKGTTKSNGIVKFLVFLAIFTVFSLIFSMLLFHTFLFNFINVLMYRGMVLIMLTGIVVFLILFVLSKRANNLCDIKDALCIAIVTVSINMVFFTLVPVTIERSVSVFTLAHIEEEVDDTITKDAAEKIFEDIYIDKNDAFGKRFSEQIVTGTIVENPDGSYTLTNLGHNLVDFFSFIAKLYNIDIKNMH